MALIGQGQGFKVLVGLCITVVLLSLPVFCMDLSIVPLEIARNTDGGLAPIEVAPDPAQRRIRISTMLSKPLADGHGVQIAVRMVAPDGSVITEFVEHSPDRGDRPGVVHIRGPLDRPTGWDRAHVELVLIQGKLVLTTVRGRYLPPRSNLQNVVQERPNAED